MRLPWLLCVKFLTFKDNIVILQREKLNNKIMQTDVIKKRHPGTFPGVVNKQETLTYSSIGRKKAANKQSNQQLIEDFTPRQQIEFDQGITIEHYAKSKGIIL